MPEVVIHHYAAAPYPQRLVTAIPAGSRIVSVAWREASSKPVVYVEKPLSPGGVARLEAFFVGTGHDFDKPDDFDFLGTVCTLTGLFFFHVYGRIVEA